MGIVHSPSFSLENHSFSFDAPASHLLKISDLLPSSKSVNPIIPALILRYGTVQTALEATITGVFAVAVFALIVKYFQIKNQLAGYGIFNKWLVLTAILFTFGFMKHEIGYFLTVESSYCKQTGICERILAKSQTTVVDKIKSGLGFLENVWFENIGEGVVFVIVGLPTFLLVHNKYFAAFATGILADLVAQYSGIHGYFCRANCNVTALEIRSKIYNASFFDRSNSD